MIKKINTPFSSKVLKECCDKLEELDSINEIEKISKHYDQILKRYVKEIAKVEFVVGDGYDDDGEIDIFFNYFTTIKSVFTLLQSRNFLRSTLTLEQEITRYKFHHSFLMDDHLKEKNLSDCASICYKYSFELLRKVINDLEKLLLIAVKAGENGKD